MTPNPVDVAKEVAERAVNFKEFYSEKMLLVCKAYLDLVEQTLKAKEALEKTTYEVCVSQAEENRLFAIRALSAQPLDGKEANPHTHEDW